MSRLVEITDDNFSAEVIEAGTSVLVDVYAQWCGPCKMIAPTLDSMADDYDNFKICKADMEENSSIVSKYSITSVPTLLFFKNGECVDRMVGLTAPDKIEEKIEEYI